MNNKIGKNGYSPCMIDRLDYRGVNNPLSMVPTAFNEES